MNLNVILRGQSNVMLFGMADGWAMLGRLEQDVQRLLGFNGTADTVTVHYAYDWADGANTVNSGTAFFGLDRTAGRRLAQRLDSARTRHPPRLHPRPACRGARRPHRALVPQRVR